MSTFSDVLGNLEGGIVFEQLNDDLAEVVQAVLKHRKEGEMTVAIKVKPNGEHAVTVTAGIKTKAPQAAKAVTTFFADEHGNLLRRDPRQQELPLRTVADDKPAALRNA